MIALCQSELSEALEEYLEGLWAPRNIYYMVSPKPEGIPIELADCIIRIPGYCGKENIDIDKAIRTKNACNKTRHYRHGGKVI